MTEWLDGTRVAARLKERFPNAVTEASPQCIVVAQARLNELLRFLKDDAELDCQYLTNLTAVDRLDHFEVVYHLCSIRHNHMLTVKTIASDHDAPVAPSVTPIWQGANFQEREAYDLMGIGFEGHPDLRRLFLWDGFPGHPLRKDFLNLPGGLQPGLQGFTREGGPE